MLPVCSKIVHPRAFLVSFLVMLGIARATVASAELADPIVAITEAGSIGVNASSANIIFSPSATRLILAFGTKRIVAWNPVTKTSAWTVDDLGSGSSSRADYLVGAMAASGDFFVVSGHGVALEPPTLEIRRTLNGEKIRDLEDPRSLPTQRLDIPALAFSTNGQFIVGACNSLRQAFLWNAETGQLIRRFENADNYGFAVGFSTDHRLIYQFSAYRDLLVWDAHSGQLLRQIDPRPLGVGQGFVIYNATVTQDMRFAVAVGCFDPAVFPNHDPCEFKAVILSLETERIVQVLSLKSHPLGVQMSADHRRILVVSQNDVELFDVAQGERVGHSATWENWHPNSFQRAFGAPWTLAADESLSTFVTPDGGFAKVWRIDGMNP